MSRPVAVYTDVVDLDPKPGVRMLRNHGFVVKVLRTADHHRILGEAQDAEVLLIGYTRVDERLLSGLPRLRLVCTQSAGVDTVDLEAAAQRGIWVANVPGAASEEVASHALAMALSLLRGLPFLDRQVRAGGWDGTAERIRRFSSSTLGVLGMGRIGRQLATFAQPLFGRVVGHDAHLPAKLWPAGAVRLNLPDLFGCADVVSLHVPLLPETRGLVGADELARMQPGSCLVNVSRGELVDHTALVAALDSGHLSGAALDVLPVEPPPADLPMLRHPRILFSPHAAYLSEESGDEYVRQQAENAIAWLRDSAPAHPVVHGR